MTEQKALIPADRRAEYLLRGRSAKLVRSPELLLPPQSPDLKQKAALTGKGNCQRTPQLVQKPDQGALDNVKITIFVSLKGRFPPKFAWDCLTTRTAGGGEKNIALDERLESTGPFALQA